MDSHVRYSHHRSRLANKLLLLIHTLTRTAVWGEILYVSFRSPIFHRKWRTLYFLSDSTEGGNYNGTIMSSQKSKLCFQMIINTITDLIWFSDHAGIIKFSYNVSSSGRTKISRPREVIHLTKQPSGKACRQERSTLKQVVGINVWKAVHGGKGITVCARL